MTRTLSIDLNTAQNWYKSNNEALREIALHCFSLEELIGKKAFKELKEQRAEEYRKFKQDLYESYAEQRREEEELYHW